MLIAIASSVRVEAQDDVTREADPLANEVAKLYEAGRYQDAIAPLERMLAIREKTLGPEHPDTVRALNNLAVLYQSTGDYPKAEAFNQRALTLYEKVFGPEAPETATSLNNLGEIYQRSGAYAKAQVLHQRALAIREKVLGEEHPATAGSLDNLARVYEGLGSDAKAEQLHQRALAIYEKVLGPDNPETLVAVNNLAFMYLGNGAYEQAEPLQLRALATNEKILGSEHPYTAASLNNLAMTYMGTGAYAKAEPLLQRALAIRGNIFGTEHPTTANSLHNLAMLEFATDSILQAEQLSARVQKIDEQTTLRLLYSGSESFKLGYARKRLWHVSADISLSLINPTTASTALGLTSVLQYKGRVLDVMSDSLARLRRSVAPPDRTLLDQLAGTAQELSNLTYGRPARSAAVPYRERLATLVQQQETLQAQLAARSTAFDETLVPISLASVREALPADTTLVEFFRYRPFDLKPAPGGQHEAGQRYVAYVLKRTGDPIAIDVGAAQPIDELITQFRGVLVDPTTNSRGAVRTQPLRIGFKQLASELYAKLVLPLRPHFLEGDRLLISPDAALNLVPFAALLDERGDYLAQHFETSYLTSGRDLLHMTDRAHSHSDSVVLAAPNYGESRSTRWPASATAQTVRSADLDRSDLSFDLLPGTAREAATLRALLKLKPNQLLMGERATEARLRTLHGPRILHLATHGFFLKDEDLPVSSKRLSELDESVAAPFRENPLLRSGLALAGANQRRSGSADDGILTAAEVAQLDLIGTQLVVLSACETALGTVDAGEGVYGLRRALVLAGAQSQLVSLWKVNDAATQALMTEYYRRLLAGEGRASALRAVQLSMLADPARQHPYYWAAFIPIGNWTPLHE